MLNIQSPAAADDQFFAALLAADTETLNELLADDFILIDVMSGSEISKAVLLGVVGPGQLRFDSIDLIESRVRIYDSSAVIIGRTLMHGRFGDTPFTASSRYTHVYHADLQGRWRLVSAQGTQIAPDPALPA